MGITQELKDIKVTATSPDGRIEGNMGGLRSVAFRFRFNDYEDYYRNGDVAVLEHQLGRGATLLATGYIKTRQEIMKQHGYTVYNDWHRPATRRHRELLERGVDLVAVGDSGDGEVRTRTRAMREFQVKIDPAVFRENDQAGFLRLAHATMSSLRSNYDRALKGLRHELYLKYKDQPDW